MAPCRPGERRISDLSLNILVCLLDYHQKRFLIMVWLWRSSAGQPRVAGTVGGGRARAVGSCCCVLLPWWRWWPSRACRQLAAVGCTPRPRRVPVTSRSFRSASSRTVMLSNGGGQPRRLHLADRRQRHGHPGPRLHGTGGLDHHPPGRHVDHPAGADQGRHPGRGRRDLRRHDPRHRRWAHRGHDPHPGGASDGAARRGDDAGICPVAVGAPRWPGPSSRWTVTGLRTHPGRLPASGCGQRRQKA